MDYAIALSVPLLMLGALFKGRFRLLDAFLDSPIGFLVTVFLLALAILAINHATDVFTFDP